MAGHSLLDTDNSALPPDPLSPVPPEAEEGLAAYRAGEAREARALLTTVADAGRNTVSGHAAMALAGIELGSNGLDGSCRTRLEQVAAGEDPWLGPLAAVLLTPDFRSCVSSDSGRALLGGLAAQLTGEPHSAREEFERAADVHEDTELGDLANILLGNLLIQSGEVAAALKPLSRARSMCDGVFAGYAGHLEGHVLLGQNDKEEAAKVLRYAERQSHPARGGSEGLYPWVAVRFGELLAGAPWLDLVQDRREDTGVSEGTVIREPFESALYWTEISHPALVDVGFHLFPGEFEPVHAGLRRLKDWSDERYERGRRLMLALHSHVEDWRDEPRSQGLAKLREQHALPLPSWGGNSERTAATNRPAAPKGR